MREKQEKRQKKKKISSLIFKKLIKTHFHKMQILQMNLDQMKAMKLLFLKSILFTLNIINCLSDSENELLMQEFEKIKKEREMEKIKKVFE